MAKGTQLTRLALWGLALLSVMNINAFAGAPPPLRVGLADTPLTFDATRASEAVSQRLIRLISFGLTSTDAQRRILPAAATLIKQDRQHFTFQLRHLTFSDGTPLTPLWVKNYYEALQGPNSLSIQKQAAQRIAYITTDDAYNSVTFTLNKEGVSPWQLFNFWGLFTAPLTHTASDGQIHGLGPYALETWAPAVIKLRPFTSPTLPPLTFFIAKDPTVRLLKLLNNEIDLLQDDMPLELFNLAQKRGMKALTAPSASYTYLGFNHSHPALHDRRVRQAIAQAINLPALRQGLMFGRAQPPRSLLLPQHPAHWAASDWSYNPTDAQKLLAEAGYTSEDPLKLTLTISANPLIFRIGQVMQQNLAKVGVQITLQTLEWASFYDAIQKGRAALYIMNLVGDFDPDIYRMLFHSTQTPPEGLNRGQVNLPQLDKLTDAMQHEFSPVKQGILAADIQKIQHQELLFLPLWRLDRFALMRPNISGYSLDPLGNLTGLLHVTHEEDPQPPTAQQP